MNESLPRPRREQKRTIGTSLAPHHITRLRAVAEQREVTLSTLVREVLQAYAEKLKDA